MRLEGHDPAEVDTLPIRFQLGRLANQRNAVKVRLARKRAGARG